MTVPPIVARVAGLVRAVSGRLDFLPPLLARIFVFYGFYSTGKGKLANLENVVRYFTALGIPAPEANAWFVAHLEFYGAMALLIGVLTRPTAAMLAGSMVVALATADKDMFLDALYFGEADITNVAPATLLVPLILLALRGAGGLSLDGIVGWLVGPLVPAALPAPPSSAPTAE